MGREAAGGKGQPGNHHRFLVVKIGAIGDVVMALPLIAFLRERDPGCRITWVCGRVVAPLIRLFDGPDEMIVVDEGALFSGSPSARLRALWSVWRPLLGRSFDVVLTGYYDRRYRILSLPVRAGKRVAWSRRAERPLPVRGRYHGDEYIRMARGDDGPDAPAAVLPRARVSLPAHLVECLDACAAPRVALAPGGGASAARGAGSLRRWPIESYVLLAERLVEQGHSLVLVGDGGDAWVRDAFRHLPALDLIGQTDLVELVGVFERCQAAVTHDIGPMHLAMVTAVPLIALFGPTLPLERVPRGSNTRVIWGGERLGCRPCYDGKHYAECRHNECMHSISVEEVEQAVLDATACGVAARAG